MLKQEDYKQHISERFNAELEGVKNRLLEMGGKVEEQLNAAVDAILAGDSGSAEAINETGQIVGWTKSGKGNHAVLWNKNSQ